MPSLVYLMVVTDQTASQFTGTCSVACLGLSDASLRSILSHCDPIRIAACGVVGNHMSHQVLSDATTAKFPVKG